MFIHYQISNHYEHTVHINEVQKIRLLKYQKKIYIDTENDQHAYTLLLFHFIMNLDNDHMYRNASMKIKF